jgi:cytochrome d ubiquinol oxidase subunit I
MDIEILSRLQFAGTIMFHYIFPPLSIGLGLLMVIFEGMWLKTGHAIWEATARFWTKIFALNFALGVASGIVMEFQFGTNWAAYSRFVGDVFGSALAAEGIFAFFLESGFLAVLVFGWDRVSRKVHFFSTLMVFLGSVFSAVWIVIANSWQQTPAGSTIRAMLDEDGNPLVIDGIPQVRAEIVDFWALVFNPSSMDRLSHVLIGAFITGAFFVMSVGCYYLLRKRHTEFAKRCITVALPIAALFAVLALVTGHDQAKTVSVTQPAKLAAFEGHFQSGPGDLYLWGWPDAETGEVKYGVKIPGMLSFLVHSDSEEPITGLDMFHEDDTPPIWLPFQMYHLMVGCGMFFIGLSLLSLFFLVRRTLFEKRWLLLVWVPSIVLPVCRESGGVDRRGSRSPAVDRLPDAHGRRARDAREPAAPATTRSRQRADRCTPWSPYDRRSLGRRQGGAGALVDPHVRRHLHPALRALALRAQLEDPPRPGRRGRAEGPAREGREVLRGRHRAHRSIRRTSHRAHRRDGEPRQPGRRSAVSYDTLTIVWFFLLGVLLIGYAILDGFDLGVGIIHPFVAKGDQQRRITMNSIGPLWDGNEVWLVTFGGALFAAFPNAYATVFSGFYSAFMLLLFALIFRAVSSSSARRCTTASGAASGTGASSVRRASQRCSSASRAGT